MNSFTKKIIKVYITLRSGTFSEDANTKIVTGVPIKARIEKTGPPDFGKATVEIQGMQMEMMERLSTLSFYPLFFNRNFINIYAGDEESGLNLAFSGEITKASADLNAAPNVRFKMECMTGYFGLVTVQSPTAVHGSQTVEQFIKSQANTMGYDFVNEGVTASVSNCIFNGSPLQQARQCAKQVGAELLLDDNTLILLPKNGSIGNAVLLNKSTGMIGYPVISSQGVEVKSLYNPKYRLGGLIKIDETLTPRAKGTWRIIKLTHDLCAFDPSGGNWESQMTTFYPAMSGAGGRI